MLKAGLLSIAVFVCVASSRGQDLPYNKSFGPAYTVATPAFRYPQEFSSIAGLDYKNFVMHTFDLQGKHWTCCRLRDGSWLGNKGGPLMEKITWRNAFTLVGNSTSQSHVLVIFDYFSGAGKRDNDLYAQVWELNGNRLEIIQQLRFNIHILSVEDSYSYDSAQGILKARATHYLPGEAHCCASSYDELSFHWDGSEFRLIKKETKRTR